MSCAWSLSARFSVAGLYLQSRDSAGTEKATVQLTGESIRDEIVLLTAERLKSWAGSADYKQGVTLFEKSTIAPVIEYSETVLVRLMPSAIEIRFVPGAGLNGMISPKSLGKRAAVAAVLALRKQLGFEVPVTTAQQSLVEPGGTPRTGKKFSNPHAQFGSRGIDRVESCVGVPLRIDW